MGVEKNFNETRLNKSNSVDIYRPPALRNITSSTADLSNMGRRTMSGVSTAVNQTGSTTLVDGAAIVAVSSVTTNNTSISCNNSPLHVNGDARSSDTIPMKVTSRNASETPPLEAASTDSQSPLATATTTTAARRERRPDRAVYIPRARRSQTTPPTAATTTITATTTTTPLQTAPTATTTTATATMMLSNSSSSGSGKQQLAITSDTTAALVSNTSSPKSDEVGRSVSRKSKSSSSSSNKERKERSSKKSATASVKNSKSSANPTSAGLLTQNKSANSKISSYQLNCDSEPVETKEVEHSEHSKFAQRHTHANEMNVSNKKRGTAKMPRVELSTEVANLLIEDAVAPSAKTRNGAKCDIDEQELQRASKEINRSNRRIMKQSFVSDVLEIPEKIEQHRNGAVEIKKQKNVSIHSALRNRSTADSTTEEEEDDDWENIYDESGDCLDPKIMQELTASVGKVKIELPKMDYSAYLTKQSILNEEEFPHVLEVSNFPVEFKNQDLLMVFSQYKESGFDIKWVDDTHALAVFSSSRIAAEVLTMGHPFVVLKPLAEATVESRLKAKKCAASLQPYRPRPETCAALARRLVTGALGVRLETAAAERENEKRVLREAKERKLLAAKQRDEIWES